MPSIIAAPKKAPAAETDFLPLQGTDYIEFYVGNAKQAAHFTKPLLVSKAWLIPDRKLAPRTGPVMPFGKTN